MSATVFTLRVPAADLTPGTIAVVSGNARYLRVRLPGMRGWHKWEYATHRPDGSVASRAVMDVADGSSVTVVCVTVDGAVVTP